MKAINKYFEELRKTPQEDIFVEKELFLKAQSGCTISRDIIFNKYALFAADQAKKLQYRKHEQDLIQEANIGLLKAIQLYDPNRGAKFTTFSVWYIKSSINTWLTNHSRTIRLPANIVNAILADNDEYQMHANAVSFDKFETPEAIDIYNNEDSSIYTDLDLDKDTKIKELISFLPSKSQYIILMRIDEECYTWEDIGKKFGYSRETARSIYNRSMEKILIKYGKKKILDFFS